METPFAGLKVVDLTHFVAGPYCTMLLGDLGCDVIKVEKPDRGDTGRHMNMSQRFAADIPLVGGDYFLAINRNKRSIGLDLKTPEGVEVCKQLCGWADIVVQNFRPGVTARLGLDYKSLQTKNPRLIYASVSAYGDEGPLADKPGMDVAVQARSGVMSITGPEGGNQPLRPGASLADFSGGIYLTTAIVTALYHRERSGRGQEVSVALIDSMMSQLISYSVAVLDGGSTVTPVGSGHPQVVPYQAFPTADGHVVISAAANKLFRTLCTVLGCEQLASDPRFATNNERVKNRDVLIPQLSALTPARTTAAWITALEAADIPCAPVNDLATAFSELAENSPGMVQTVQHPRAGELHQLGVPFKFGSCEGNIRRPPPMLGEHTEEILKGVLGKTAEEIDLLRQKKAIDAAA